MEVQPGFFASLANLFRDRQYLSSIAGVGVKLLQGDSQALYHAYVYSHVLSQFLVV